MDDFLNKVIVGNVVFYPKIIRQYLIKSHYFMSYDPQKETATLNVNHGGGGEVLFEIRNVSHESAEKIAKNLGLVSRSSLEWSKWNPILRLYHDGSAEAEKLRVEMLLLRIPHTTEQSKILGLNDGFGLLLTPSYTVENMLEVVRETAKQYEEQLNTKP